MKDIFSSDGVASTPARAGVGQLIGETITPEKEGNDNEVSSVTGLSPAVDNRVAPPTSPSSPSISSSPSSPSSTPDNAEPVEKQRFFAQPIDQSVNMKRIKTSMPIDSEDGYTMNRNVILPLDALLAFFEDNFSCKRCHKTLHRPLGDPTAMDLEVHGIACGINFHCSNCGYKSSLRPDIVPSSMYKLKTLLPGNNYATRVNTGDFVLNRRLHLGLQLCGNGRQEGKILAGMLNLNVNPMKHCWTEVQEVLGKVLIQIGNEILEENLHIKCLLSPVGADGCCALDDAIDT